MTTADQAVPLETGLTATSVKRFSLWWLGPAAVTLALLSAFVTFIVLAGLTPIAPTHWVVVNLLLTTAATALVLIAVIAREVWQIVQARRSGRAASRLHVRIIALFSVIAAVPAILVAIVASVTLDRGLDRLFSLRTRAVIENSLAVSEAYLREHAQTIRADVLAMSNDLGRAKTLFNDDRERFRQFFAAQAAVRGLPAAVIIDSNLSVIERANRLNTQDFVAPSRAALGTVTETDPQVALIPDANYVAAIVKIRDYNDLYLYVVRILNPLIVAQARETRASVGEYSALGQRRLGVQIAFALMYSVIALIVLLSAVWIGLNFANRLVAPIRRLIGAANVVSTGNLHVQVPIRQSEGDLAQLGETFNKMTQELRTQHDDLIRARDQIDTRRRFTEAVLAGASAGVIGVDPLGAISIMNRSAEKLIGCSEVDALGRPLSEVVPELSELIASLQTGDQRLVQNQVTISRQGRERNLSVRVTSEQSSAYDHGYVVTLDDITELVAAQRTSAWADVARRIAHEIKNPLTPIQLSAERLLRKYGTVIKEDRSVFEQCTQTIVRQVDDIKRMVDEFSHFARMPKPVIAADDVADAVRQTVFLMRVGHADIDIELKIAEEPMLAQFDRRLIAQALTNIIKNASEGIAAVPADARGRGHIDVAAMREGRDIVIDVLDNGIGLPKDNRNRLLEPYVTTHEKGTGLGLAIVGRILEDHGGRIELKDADEKYPVKRGAWIRLRFASEGVPAAVAAKPENIREVVGES
ncbi:MAG: PAS domain-containing sensor histidine kinase [Rhizobiales bacterium]|nr:PAS domain-containing sensor histidine kinase [Hyphomicrobiales bacterium]